MFYNLDFTYRVHCARRALETLSYCTSGVINKYDYESTAPIGLYVRLYWQIANAKLSGEIVTHITHSNLAFRCTNPLGSMLDATVALNYRL